MVEACYIEYIRRFITARNYKIYMDGTFKSSSNSFYQVYIIHSDFNGQSYHLFYCFLSNKTEETYVNVFSMIKSSLRSYSL